MGRFKRKGTVTGVLLAIIAATSAYSAASEPPAVKDETKRPNIVMIVADDMGYSDLGSFGGEIHTPTFDALANSGVRFTDFHTGSACSPTRSMLFAGTDSHIAGVGNMSEMLAPSQRDAPGHEGYMNRNVVSFVNLLRDSGYHTYMTGKWHLGKLPDLIPRARGFERDFSMMEGESSYFDDMIGVSAGEPKTPYTEDGRYLTRLPKEFKYATEYYVDKMIGYIESNRKDGKPFFAYLAHQAPHAPYHLPDEWLRKYEGKYDIGWTELRKRRMARMKEIGIVPQNATLADRLWYVPVWEDFAPFVRVVQARKMALYASLTENMDYETGRLIDYLKKIGEYDKTIFIFFSDNGAEGNDIGATIASTPGTRDFLHYAREYSQTHPNAWGRPHSEVTYGPGWAQVSATPLRDHKMFESEGGIRTPLIIAGEGVKQKPGTINRSLTHVMDLAPTILELAGVKVPTNYEGKPVQEVQGKSLMPLLAAKIDSVRGADDWLGWELAGNRAIRKGDWKLVRNIKPYGTGNWELYNLAEDLGEKHDLSAREPKKLQEMIALWDEYVRRNKVVLPDMTMFDILEYKLPHHMPVDDTFPPMKFRKPFVPPKELLKDE